MSLEKRATRWVNAADFEPSGHPDPDEPERMVAQGIATDAEVGRLRKHMTTHHGLTDSAYVSSTAPALLSIAHRRSHEGANPPKRLHDHA